MGFGGGVIMAGNYTAKLSGYDYIEIKGLPKEEANGNYLIVLHETIQDSYTDTRYMGINENGYVIEHIINYATIPEHDLSSIGKGVYYCSVRGINGVVFMTLNGSVESNGGDLPTSIEGKHSDRLLTYFVNDITNHPSPTSQIRNSLDDIENTQYILMPSFTRSSRWNNESLYDVKIALVDGNMMVLADDHRWGRTVFIRGAYNSIHDTKYATGSDLGGNTWGSVTYGDYTPDIKVSKAFVNRYRTSMVIEWKDYGILPFTGNTGLSITNVTPSITITDISHKNDTTTLTLSRKMQANEEPKLKYVKGNFEDSSSNELENFTDVAITNNADAKRTGFFAFF